MQNSMLSPAVAGLVGALAAIAVVASGLFTTSTTGRGAVKRMAHAIVHLDPQPNGDCRITTTPQLLEVYKREVVQWSVINRCAIDTEVEVVFTPGQDPLDTSANCIRRGRKKMQCGINNNANARSYKYEVRANGALTEDPELEIVQ